MMAKRHGAHVREREQVSTSVDSIYCEYRKLRTQSQALVGRK